MQRATLISCLALLSGERHSWGDRAILWTTGHTNKQYSLFLSSLINTFTTFYRQTFTSRKVCQKKLILTISPSLFHLNISYSLLSPSAPSYCLSMCIFLIVCMYLSVSIKRVFLKGFFFLASHCNVDCLAGLAQCWFVQQVNMFYQPQASTHFLVNLEMAIFFGYSKQIKSICTWKAHFV